MNRANIGHTFISAHVPTLDAEEEAKELLNDNPQGPDEGIPPGDMLFVIGNYKARPDGVDLATPHTLNTFFVYLTGPPLMRPVWLWNS